MRGVLDRGHGLRFSLTDGGVILAAAALTGVAWTPLGSLALLIPFVVGHFFLFCNVVRLRRRLELAWAGTVVIHTCAWLLLSDADPRTLPVWWLFCAIQLPITALVVGIEVRSPRYHGVLGRGGPPRPPGPQSRARPPASGSRRGPARSPNR